MKAWHPNWTTLNGVAASFLASTPLAARIKTVTPVGGYVAVGLQSELSEIMAAAAKAVGPLSAPLVIAVDTLNVAAGKTVLAAPAVSIVARVLQVDDGGTATLSFDEGTSLQVTTASIVGAINVGSDSSSVALTLSSLSRLRS